MEEEVGELPNILIHVQLGSVSSLLAPKIKSRPNPVRSKYSQTCSKSSNFYDMRILLNLIFGTTYHVVMAHVVSPINFLKACYNAMDEHTKLYECDITQAQLIHTIMRSLVSLRLTQKN